MIFAKQVVSLISEINSSKLPLKLRNQPKGWEKMARPPAFLIFLIVSLAERFF